AMWRWRIGKAAAWRVKPRLCFLPLASGPRMTRVRRRSSTKRLLRPRRERLIPSFICAADGLCAGWARFARALRWLRFPRSVMRSACYTPWGLKPPIFIWEASRQSRMCAVTSPSESPGGSTSRPKKWWAQCKRIGRNGVRGRRVVAPDDWRVTNRPEESGLSPSTRQLSHFSHQIFTTLRTHACGVRRLARNIEALARFVCGGLPINRNRHLAGQDDMGRDIRELMRRIIHVRTVFPNIYVVKPFILQLLRQQLFVHYSKSPGAFSESSMCNPLFNSRN